MKYGRTYNFSAGPAMMPEEVLEEIAAEIGMIVRELYVQLYRNAGPLVAKGCKAVILSLLGEKSPVWDVNVPGAQSAVYMSGAAAEAMLERMRRAEGGRQHDKD